MRRLSLASLAPLAGAAALCLTLGLAAAAVTARASTKDTATTGTMSRQAIEKSWPSLTISTSSGGHAFTKWHQHDHM